jgi:NTE family protein
LAAVWSIFENKLETLTNSSPIIDKSSYLSAFVYMKYDSFNDKNFPKKRMVFFWDIQSYLLSSDYTNEFQPFNIAKGDFGVAATVFKRATIKANLKLVLLSVMVHFF